MGGEGDIAMRSNIILVGGAAWVLLLWASPAGALSPDTSCENTKLRAAGAYAKCLARVARNANTTGGELSEAAIGRCDAHFDRAFERAEANSACRTAGGPATLRGPILGQMEDTFATTTTGPGCPSTPSLDQDTSTYACTLKSGSAIDLAAIVAQIGSGDVTDDTVVWIEAWGGDGGPGNTSNGGSGGSGGYAQIGTTVNDLLEFFGTSELHYYLGLKGGGPAANAGGDGGTATLVTINDLTSESANLDDTLLVAGGGGGGGGGRGTATACGNISASELDVLGGGGGAGAEAISTANTVAFAVGEKGGARRSENYSGSGGGGDVNGPGGAVNGGSAEVGGNGFAAIGGVGGNHNDPATGFTNQTVSRTTAGFTAGGRGGQPGDEAGGGGGGGGYGGGGGGRQGDGDSDCVSGGGGGGGSLASVSTQSCSRSRPANPNGAGGAVQIVFDAGSCS
jgi:hypothetical protein